MFAGLVIRFSCLLGYLLYKNSMCSSIVTCTSFWFGQIWI